MSHWVVCPQALGRPSASGREAAGLAQHRAREGRGARETWSRSSEDHTERPGSGNGLRRSLASSRPSDKVVRVRILDNIEADLWQRGLPQAPRSSVQAPVRSLKPGSRPPKARPVARQELDTSFESSPLPGIRGPEAKAEFLESIEGSVPLSQSQAQVGAVVTGPHPPEKEPPPVQGGEASLEGSSLEEKRGFEAAFEALDQWHTGVESSLSRVEEALGGVSQLSSELSSLQEELNQLLRECDHAFPTKEEASLPRAEQDGEDRNNNYNNNNNEKNAIVKEEEQKKDLVAFTFAGVVAEEEKPEPSVCGGPEGTDDVRKQQEEILQGERKSQQNGGGRLISAGGVGLDGGRGSQKRHIFQVPRAVRSRRSRNLTKSKRFQKHVRSTLPTVVEEEPPLLLPGPSGCTEIVLRSAPSVAIGGQTDLDCVVPGWNVATSGGVDQVSAQEAMSSRMEIACTLPVHICLNLRGLDMDDVMTGLGSVSNFLREKDPTLQMCGVVSSDMINVVLRRAPVPSVLEFPGKLKGMLGGSINPRRPGACCRGVGFICKGREVFEYCGCDGIGRPSQTGAAAARDGEDFVESNRNAQKLRVARVLPMGAVISCGLAPRNTSTLASVAGGLVGERSLVGSLRINEIVDLAPKSRQSTLDSARRHANNKDETARSDLYNVIVSKRKRRIMMSRRGSIKNSCIDTLDRCDGFKARNRTLRTQDSASDFDSFNIRVAEDSALLDNVTESFNGVDDNAPAGMENNFPKRYSDFEDLNGAENNANCEQQGPAGGWGSSLSYGETVAVLYATEGGRIAMFTSAENNKCGNRAKEQQQQQENNTSGWRDQMLQGLFSMAGGGPENDGSPDMDMEEEEDDAEFSGRDVQEFELVDLNKREGGKLRASEITFAGMAVEAMAADSAWIKRLWNTCRDAVRSCFAAVFGQLLGVG
ncbi:hypothetical protein BSKO_08700 [Bryopsis sp. KO-2023]|nr:hypothetical protein BSKO_08700 [Bryopsis sp. KO-2023]